MKGFQHPSYHFVSSNFLHFQGFHPDHPSSYFLSSSNFLFAGIGRDVLAVEDVLAVRDVLAVLEDVLAVEDVLDVLTAGRLHSFHGFHNQLMIPGVLSDLLSDPLTMLEIFGSIVHPYDMLQIVGSNVKFIEHN